MASFYWEQFYWANNLHETKARDSDETCLRFSHIWDKTFTGTCLSVYHRNPIQMTPYDNFQAAKPVHDRSRIISQQTVVNINQDSNTDRDKMSNIYRESSIDASY
jgi:hypothetical protein